MARAPWPTRLVLRGRLALSAGGGDLEPLRRLVRHEADPALLVMESANGKGEPPRPEMQAMAGADSMNRLSRRPPLLRSP